ncbi:type VII secretion-associated serine protease mycosin [Carbonactinospora thermoautotrophica]|uniref:type VII secretion-associated serine protease mycosin n=1 Tax=Carbonactinospora thermoautotrophica TaxID=1469144 RepID=UPI0022721880|nr:type VII secretion-associated serine protease mycosin [Carbonactinospora thermoautotrophica]MCX9192707.1 type VII secretion-associated serine protease mycosin [Carbonactinospora thermoautotrophica]
MKHVLGAGRGSKRGWSRAAVVVAAALLAALAGGQAQAASRTWHIDDFKIREIWQITRGEGVKVGVLDTGVDASHPDLAGQVEPGRDFGDGSTDKDGTTDPKGHGTGMASVIAAKGGSAKAAWGVAPGAKIVPLTIFLRSTAVSGTAKAAAIRYAADHGIKVVCIAVGGAVDASFIREAVNYALQRDVVIVAAAGNDGNGANKVEFPASYPGVISVGAIDPDRKIRPTSTHNSHVVLAAPGGNIWSAQPHGQYRLGSGTSPATAYVAGVAALLRAAHPDWTAGQVIRRLIKTADDAGTPGKDDYYGYGIVDPYEALTSDLPPGPRENPLAPGLGSPTPEAQPAQWGQSGEDAAGSMFWVYLVLFVLVVVGTVVFVLVMLLRSRRGPKQGPPGPWGPGSPGPYGPPPQSQRVPAPDAGGWPPPGQQPPPGWRPPR